MQIGMTGLGAPEGSSLTSVCPLVCRWPVPIHSEVVLLHRTACLLIRCWEGRLSEQENVSFLYAVGFFGFVLIYFCSSFFLLNARSVEA